MPFLKRSPTRSVLDASASFAKKVYDGTSALALATAPLESAIRLALAPFLDHSESRFALKIEEGRVTMTNVKLKSDAINVLLRSMDLPFAVPVFYIETVEVKLPWLNWVSGRIEAKLSTLILVVKPVYSDDRRAEDVRTAKEELVAKAMAALYKSMRKQDRTSPPSFLESLLQKIKSSVALKLLLTVSHVHVRLEDHIERVDDGEGSKGDRTRGVHH